MYRGSDPQLSVDPSAGWLVPPRVGRPRLLLPAGYSLGSGGGSGDRRIAPAQALESLLYISYISAPSVVVMPPDASVATATWAGRSSRPSRSASGRHPASRGVMPASRPRRVAREHGQRTDRPGRARTIFIRDSFVPAPTVRTLTRYPGSGADTSGQRADCAAGGRCQRRCRTPRWTHP
jgi:hypothetical protein